MEKEAHNYLKTSVGKSKLIPILQWVDKMTKDSTDSPIKPVARRAIVYANAIIYANAIAKAYAHANAIAIAQTNAIAQSIAIAHNFASAIASAIAVNADYIANANEVFVKLANLFSQDRIFSSVNIPELIADLEDLKQSISNNYTNERERQEFIDQLFKTWNRAFSLTPESLNLSKEELKEIDENYFYINRLILDCQKVAVNISPSVWQELENRMLRVP
jgi:hypothetical protein